MKSLLPVLFVLLLLPLSSPAASKPNILFILTDDQGAWTIGARSGAGSVTPNLDRLRAEGATLTHCYTPTPVCSPARASLLTSRYGTEVGITDYLIESGDTSAGLSRAFATWPRLLAEAGYATGLIGKYHCGERPESHPTQIGYQEFIGFIHGAGTSIDPEFEIGGQRRRVSGWTEDLIADYAIDFIRRHQHEPFALSVHSWAPHANIQQKTADGDRTWLPVSPVDWAALKDFDPPLPQPLYPRLDVPRAKRMMREYLASVHSVDRNIGRILRALEELGLANNTLVVFSSDNGFNIAHHGIWHKGNGRWLLVDNKGSRPNLWETSLQVPALVRWPGVITPGAEYRQVVTHLDWFPTLLAAAGITPPPGLLLYGRNLLPLLKGNAVQWPDELYAQYTMRKGPVMRSYQTDHWKLVRYLSGGLPDEFYDRTADPEELTNLFTSPDPHVRSARLGLDAQLREKMHAIDDPASGQAPALDSAHP